MYGIAKSRPICAEIPTQPQKETNIAAGHLSIQHAYGLQLTPCGGLRVDSGIVEILSGMGLMLTMLLNLSHPVAAGPLSGCT